MFKHNHKRMFIKNIWRNLWIIGLEIHLLNQRYRSSPPKVFLRKGVLKICSKFTGEHSCRSVISVKGENTFSFRSFLDSCHWSFSKNISPFWKVQVFISHTPELFFDTRHLLAVPSVKELHNSSALVFQLMAHL